jgi:hypothetical protein
MKYLLNSMMVPVDFSALNVATVMMRRISLDEARKLLNDGGFISAVGHPGTAQLLTELLGIEVPVNRVAVQLKSGDIGIHFVLTQRLPEGKVLSKEELAKLDYYFVASYVL